MGHGLGQPQITQNRTFFSKLLEAKSKEKPSDFARNQTVFWLRGLDLNQRPPGYELPLVSPSALAQCFPGLFEPEIAQNPKVVPLRSTAIFSSLGHGFGSGLNLNFINAVLKICKIILIFIGQNKLWRRTIFEVSAKRRAIEGL